MVKKFVSLFMAVTLIFTSVPTFATAIAEASKILSLDNTPTISVKDVQVNNGATTAEVEVWIENNPGISSTKMNIGYDDEMVLTGIVFNSAFGTYVTAPEPYTNPQPLSVISPSADLNENGLFATLTFDISNVSEGKESLDVTVDYEQENTFNASFDDIVFETKNGKITFKDDEITVEKLEILTSSTENTVVVQSPEKIDDLKLYVAAYQGDTMLGASSQDADIKVGKNTFYVTPTWDTSKCEYARAFLWDESLIPYAEQTLTTKPSVAVQNAQVDYEKNIATVDVAVLKNPGISSLKMNVGYDSNLKLTKVDYNTEVFGTYITAPEPYTNPQPISFISPIEDVHADGTLVTLTFDISNVPKGCEFANVSIDCDQENTFNGNFDEVAFSTVDGKINFDNSVRLMGEEDFSLMEVEPLTLTVAGKTAMQGKTVDVDVVISNNPGISALKVSIAYDEVLTLQNVVLNSAFPQVATPVPYQNPQSISLMSPLAEVSVNGTLATLTFLVADDVENGYEANVSATYNKANILDMDLNEVEMNVFNGSVKVFDFIPGDVNNDGSVNLKDAVLLFRYVGDMGVEVNEKAIDVTGDGVATLKDAVLLFRYASGWKVELIPGTICEHELTETARKEATCAEDGNIQYWHCSKCDEYFEDADAKTAVDLADTVIKATGHTIVTDPAVAPTYTTTGLTEGKHCSVCGYIEVKQEIVSVLQKEEYSITYYIDNNDEYLQSQIINNPNPQKYSTQDGLVLQDLIVSGYEFDGWHTTQTGSNVVTEIKAGEKGNKVLYAHWKKVEYTISFYSPIVEKTSITRTIDEEVFIPDLQMHQYKFMGWTDADGNVVTSVKPGTGNIKLYANWVSYRNQTISNDYSHDEPIIIEDDENGQYFFVYYIGKMINVPIYTIRDFGNTTSGIIRHESISVTDSISTMTANSITKSVVDATTNSATWTLSKDWNELVTNTEDFSESDLQENKILISDGYVHEDSNTDNIGTVSDTGTLTKENTTTKDLSTTKKGNSAEIGAELAIGKDAWPVNVDISGKYEQHKDETTEDSTEIEDATDTYNIIHTNDLHSKTSSDTYSSSVEVSDVITKSTEKMWGFSIANSVGGSDVSSETTESTKSNSNTYTTSFSYSTQKTTTEVKEFSTENAVPGWHRLVQAGTVHVFAVVGFDIKTRSYYTYTFGALDDETYEFYDYSAHNGDYNDYETGVLPFEVPIDVHEYVTERVYCSSGFIIDANTGTVESYNGDDEYVYIPDYYSYDNGDGTYRAIKITGISPKIFKENENIKRVRLSNHITEIPESAFEGCTSLKEVLCPNVKAVGKNAFAGCTSLSEFVLPEDITAIGETAFKDVPSIKVVAPTKEIAEAATMSGAQNIILDISAIDEEDANDISLSVGEIESFELWGKTKEYSGLNIESDARTTIINGVTFKDCSKIPLVISSQKIVLDRVVVDCDGYALIMKNADSETDLVLNQGVKLNSAGENAIVGKNVNLLKKASNISASLAVTGDVLICGEISGTELLSLGENSEVVFISEDEFAKYVEGVYTLTLDANEGNVEETTITVLWNNKVGTLPVPTRDYYTFDGWYTELEGGEKYTEETIFKDVNVGALYAHWTQNPESDWVLASEVPDGAEVVETKYSYNYRTTQTSSANTMDGYTLYDTTWIWGAEQGPVTYDPTSADGNREVTRSETVQQGYNKTQYHYYHFCCSSGKDYLYTYKKSSSYTPHEIWLDGELTYYKTSGNIDWYGTTGDSVWCSSGNSCHWFKANGEGNANYVPYTRQVWVDTSYTQWYYHDKIYTYHFEKIESLESSTYPSGEGVSNVIQYVRYRAK